MAHAEPIGQARGSTCGVNARQAASNWGASAAEASVRMQRAMTGRQRDRAGYGLQAGILCQAAAWCKSAAGRNGGQVGRCAANGLQGLATFHGAVRAALQQRHGVGWRGLRISCSAVPSSTMRPAYITAMRSATSTAAPMSCVTKITQAQLALQFAQQQQDLDLHRGVQRGGGFVGQQHLRVAGQGQRDHGALAHAARHLVRIGLQALLRAGNAHALEQLQRARSASALRTPGSWRRMASTICAPTG
jgi:hypothetical protein